MSDCDDLCVMLLKSHLTNDQVGRRRHSNIKIFVKINLIYVQSSKITYCFCLKLLSSDWLIVWNSEFWFVDWINSRVLPSWLIIWNTNISLVHCLKYWVLIGQQRCVIVWWFLSRKMICILHWSSSPPTFIANLKFWFELRMSRLLQTFKRLTLTCFT